MTNVIKIWEPRYKDDVALIASHKVKSSNIIVFTKAKHLEGLKFNLPSSVIKSYPKSTNGKIACYAVPMSVIRGCSFE